MYNKNLIKELIAGNLGANNTEVAKLYNERLSETNSVECIRKTVAKVRKKLGLPNPVELKNYASKAEFKLPKAEIGFTDEAVKKVNNDKGTFESVVDTTFDPKDDAELAALHKIDLTKYKISTYWSKLKSNGKFTSSVNCSLRKLGDSLSIDEVKDAISTVINDKTVKPAEFRKVVETNEKALIIWVSDEHVGASVKNELYTNEWNKTVYYQRKREIVETIKQQALTHGKFDNIIFCTLGDTLDGYNGETTRGGHKLPQNMTNKEAIETYVYVNRHIIDEIVGLNLTNSYKIYNVENSNHGGLGWDAAANLALEMYLKTKYSNFKITQFENIIDSFSYGINDFHLTHGKDDTHMKRNLPLFLNDKTENYIKEYIDERGYSQKRPQHFVKGDLHQYTTQQGRFCTYTNIPSLFGASGWSMANFGKGKAGFCYSVVPKDNSNFSFTPVWIK